MEDSVICPRFLKDIIGQCKANPSRRAIINPDGRVCTYGELISLAKKTSGYLKEHDIAKGSFIVISLPNSMEYMAIELGVWMAGCIIVPVSPYYPKSRIEYISEHCESSLVVDEAVLANIANSHPIEICEPSQDIAAIFYTSGSTGKPKGVIHTFETLSHIERFEEIIDINCDDCFATGAPFSFIAWTLLLPFLRKGASIRLIAKETMTDTKSLESLLFSKDISCTFVNPSALRLISLRDNRNLRFVVTGSERVSNLAPESSYKLFNLYGMTETTPIACVFDIKEPYANTPIGKPLSDYDLKIMEDGEICLRGTLTPGYYKDTERSATLWKDGWLHTGDMGRMLPDGNIEYVNRKDWMVKINGQRVETGEISYAIKEMPGVSNATAKGFVAKDGRQYIVAYYVAEDSVTEDALVEFISKKLAPYMIPSRFVKMSSLPLNFNGKIDINSLQSPLDTESSGRRDIVQPESDMEKRLCHAFEVALGTSPVGVEDDFFALGGDSIRVMQLQRLCPELDLSSTLI